MESLSIQPVASLSLQVRRITHSPWSTAESGTVTIFQSNGKSLTLLGPFDMPHAHTVSVDPKTDLVYFPLENVDGHPLLRIMRPIDQK